MAETVAQLSLPCGCVLGVGTYCAEARRLWAEVQQAEREARAAETEVYWNRHIAAKRAYGRHFIQRKESI